MFKKHLLYLTNEHLLSVIWRNGKTQEIESFATDAAGQALFADYAKRWASLRTYVLVDLIEEDFRLDTIPHVRGNDRRELIERKLNQMYRGTPYRHAIVIDREVGGRRDDRVLYTSITNPELLTPWLDILDNARAPVVGIYSAPLLSVRLLKPLSQTAKHVLLVTLHQGNQLRQSYSYAGKTKFSRMTPLGSQAGRNRTATIREEVRKTWQYLESLRYFESGESLNVCLVGRPDELAADDEELSPQLGLNYQFFDIAIAAKNIGMTQPLANSNAEWLLLHSLGRLPPKNHFARLEITHRSSIWRIKQWGIAAGAASLVLGASLGSANFLDGKLTANKVAQLQLETARVEQERQSIMQTLPTSSVAPELMGNTVNFYNQTVKAAPDFGRAISAVSQVLSRYPDIELIDLAWATTSDPSKPLAIATALGLDLPKSSPNGGAPAVNAPTAATSDASGLFQVLIFVAKINNVEHDQRKALEHIAALRTALEADLGANVSVLAQPLDTSAGVSLHGSAKPEPEKNDTQFALKILLR